MRDVLAREHPEAHVSLSSEVWPEYREYERTVTTLVDAFAKGRVSGYVERIGARLAAELGSGVPFQVMKSNGGVISAREVVSHPITTILSGPAAGALGAAFLAAAAGFDRILTMDAGGTSTDVCLVEGGEPGLTTDGAVGRFPGQGADDRPRHRGDRRRLDRLARAGRRPQGRAGQRGRGPRPHVLRPRRHAAHGHRRPARPRPHPAAPPRAARCRCRSIWPGRASRRLAGELGLTPERTAEGILEIAAWNQANAVEQMSVKRGLDPRDYTLVAFGGSGPLQAGRLVELLGLRAAVDPGVARDGLRLRPPHRRPQERLRPDRGPASRAARPRPRQRPPGAARGAGRRRARRARACRSRRGRLVRLADLRYFGQAWEVTVELPPGAIDAARAAETVERFHAAHEKRYGYSYRDRTVRVRPGPARESSG